MTNSRKGIVMLMKLFIKGNRLLALWVVTIIALIVFIFCRGIVADSSKVWEGRCVFAGWHYEEETRWNPGYFKMKVKCENNGIYLTEQPDIMYKIATEPRALKCDVFKSKKAACVIF